MKLTPQQFDVIMARPGWPHAQDVADLIGHIAALDAEIARLQIRVDELDTQRRIRQQKEYGAVLRNPYRRKK